MRPEVASYALFTIFAGLMPVLLAASHHDDLPQVALAHPNCPTKCGNVTIPYPFGVGDSSCYYNDPSDKYPYFYRLECNNSTNPPTLTYGNGLEVLNLSLDGEFRVKHYVSFACYNILGIQTMATQPTIDMQRFTISTTQNILVAIGCNTFVQFNEIKRTTNSAKAQEFHSGCVSWCSSLAETKGKSCSDNIGCCQANIRAGVSAINISTKSFNNHSKGHDFIPCSAAFVVAKDAMPSFQSFLSRDEAYYSELMLPMIFDWSIGTENCATAQSTNNGTKYLCKGNSKCIDWHDKPGYRCECNSGYQGNPYLHDCQDIDECTSDTKTNMCEAPAYCVNFPGTYACDCPRGHNRGNGRKDDPCIQDQANKLSIASIIIIGVGGGIVVSLIVGICVHWQHGNRLRTKLGKSFFRENGGHILLRKLNSRDASADMIKVYTYEELKKATGKYSEKSIVGRGGFGMVYKGTLQMPNNQEQVVVIKKCLKVASSKVEQFINEILVLSQIKDRNIVKLLGCCLETEEPLLVYEYISNGSLHEHLQDETKASFLTWDVRLKIACEIAEVIAYLHTTISIPIIHRNIKSVNILLDENCIGKMSDFGASKLAQGYQEQFATIVQGTHGYLDPEYMQTGELTEKSDVYSFGVVLVELLTREKAISNAKPENERCLAIYFLHKLKENRLFEILDETIVNDKAMESLKEVAYLAMRCLKLKGENRPTMKQVARELEKFREKASRSWSNNNFGEIVQETEYLHGEAQIVDSVHRGNELIDR